MIKPLSFCTVPVQFRFQVCVCCDSGGVSECFSMVQDPLCVRNIYHKKDKVIQNSDTIIF